MTPAHVTFANSPVSDQQLLADLPSELRSLLEECNGFIAYGGGLHVRAACLEPAWHSLRDAWHGPRAYWRFYRSLTADDIPFAQDCVGDQFVLRDSIVSVLRAEIDELEQLGLTLGEFFREAAADPDEVLSMGPLGKHLANGGLLAPGQLLHAYPPFCMRETTLDNVSLRAISADELRGYLCDLASQIRDVPNGGLVSIEVT